MKSDVVGVLLLLLVLGAAFAAVAGVQVWLHQSGVAAVEPGTVVLEHARGFTLNDRLLRPAMVGVASAPPAGEPG